MHPTARILFPVAQPAQDPNPMEELDSAEKQEAQDIKNFEQRLATADLEYDLGKLFVRSPNQHSSKNLKQRLAPIHLREGLQRRADGSFRVMDPDLHPLAWRTSQNEGSSSSNASRFGFSPEQIERITEFTKALNLEEENSSVTSDDASSLEAEMMSVCDSILGEENSN